MWPKTKVTAESTFHYLKHHMLIVFFASKFHKSFPNLSTKIFSQEIPFWKKGEKISGFLSLVKVKIINYN